MNPATADIDGKPVVGDIGTSVDGITVGAAVLADDGNGLAALATGDLTVAEQEVSIIDTRVKEMIEQWRLCPNS